MLHPPLPPASDRFGRLQATGYRHEEGFLRCESLPTGCIVTIPVPVPVPISGFPGFLSIVQQRPVSKPERLLEPLALEPCRAEPCYVMLCCVVFFYRDTKYEVRNTRHETRDTSSGIKESKNPKIKNQEPKNPRTQEPKNQEPKNPEPKNPKIKNPEPKNPKIQEPKNPRTQESMIKVNHYVVRRALPGNSDNASVCRFSCVRCKA